MLPCIAAVAIATFVGKQAYESSALESNSLLAQNVEALSSGEDAPWFRVQYRNTEDCEYALYVGAKGSVKLHLGGLNVVEVNVGTDGFARYQLPKGEVICEGSGTIYCQPRNCPTVFWER